MIRKWANKFIEALRQAVARSTTLDEVIFGVIIGFLLLTALNFFGCFN